MPKLPRDELVGCASAHGADRVEVPRVVHAMVRKAEHAQPLSVNVANLPAVNSSKQSLAGRQATHVFLEDRPRPLGDSHDPIARVRLRAASADLAPRYVHVALYARQRSRNLDVGAVEKCEQRAAGRYCPYDDGAHVTQIEFHGAWPARWRRLNVADGVRTPTLPFRRDDAAAVAGRDHIY